MKVIIAVFIYLGLASHAETTISAQDIQDHRIEIERTLSDPDFYEFATEVLELDGITQIDIEEY